MNAQVQGKTAARGELHGTYPAAERTDGVGPHVRGQVAPDGEAHGAEGAVEATRRRVYPLVHPQAKTVPERLGALRTLVGPVAQVHPHVPVQVGPAGELLQALTALERGFRPPGTRQARRKRRLPRRRHNRRSARGTPAATWETEGTRREGMR